jgi:nitroreductase
MVTATQFAAHLPLLHESGMPNKASRAEFRFREDFMTIDLAAADALLSTTRAVRKRLDFSRPVPRQVILDCIRLSQQAPTASNSQTWQWIVIDDADKRQKIAKLYRDAAGTMLEDARKAAHAAGEAQTERVYGSAEYLAEHMHEVPALVIPYLPGKPYQGHEGAYFASIYPAVWSFQLALRPRGLGTCLTTLLGMKAQETADLLGIPGDMTQCALLPVAYTIGTEFKPAARPDVETIVHWNGW